MKPLWCGLESVVPQWLPEWSSLDLCFAIGILEVELGFPRKDYDFFLQICLHIVALITLEPFEGRDYVSFSL